ncbi:MAG: hypothetical protein GY697_16360 [Desulfobacterales bacterium]|nr:hypothetical protein [Desulfobacterales bacterium]
MTGKIKYKIIDDLETANRGAIEIEFELENGQRRWAFFFTPEGISACGDWIPETKVRFHLGVPHMIVVSDISEEIIDRTVGYLESEGLIETHTMLFEEEEL